MKVVFLTGAARGLGLAMVSFFAKKGFRVFATARKMSLELSQLTSDSVVFDELDVTDTEACRESLRRCITCFGYPDLVINNASGMTGGKLVGSYDAAEIDGEFSLSLLAPIHITNIALELRKAHQMESHLDLFFISSSSALIGHAGNEQYPLYAAAKAAIIRFADCVNSGTYNPSVLAHTVIPHNIRDNNFLDENAASYTDVCRVIEFALQSNDNMIIPRYEIEPRRSNG